jgi:hypothetical protein
MDQRRQTDATPLLGDRSASFILRIWREQGEFESSTTEWRGSIEHVGSGQRIFFRELSVIGEFLKPHLDSLDIDPDQRFWEHIDSTLAPAAPINAALDLAQKTPSKRRPRR